MAREITLTKGFVALVDDEDFDALAAHRWHAMVSATGNAYAGRKTGPRSGRKLVLMHRVICHAPEGLLVDHFDHNTLNNRRSNLRLATRSQNNVNRVGGVSKKSPFKGACLDRGAWRSSIKFKGVVFNLGRHKTAEEAARAYDAKARELHGEFAHLNFRDEAT